MQNFIEVTRNGKKVLINLRYVACVRKDFTTGGAHIELDYGYIPMVDTGESYEEVRQMIAAAQGGIPMQPDGWKAGKASE